ncbi:ABC transporter substrate-binding protein [Paenibacillus guangzhouensis]|uniref:ABC transporter substrate-binding protein n=1 Tax=Paenibacillus guangzhouensis TaxID=1473112 RepID=UPI00187B6092|nr:extracellular solute-binding protein [Paenibacillus guangzhouensis]
MSNKRNTLMLFVMLLLILLLLTPMNGVTPNRNTEKREQDTSQVAIAPSGDQAEREEKLTVSVSLEPAQFAVLQSMNQRYMQDHQMVVELSNTYPQDAYHLFAEQSMLGDAADVMLLQSEWVNKFAVSGYLLPVDSYFSGVAASEPLDWLMNQVKWNGYIWGIPKDVDPYILVWNPKLLRELSMDQLPSEREGWINLERYFSKLPNAPYLIAADLNDGYQILSSLRRLGSLGEISTFLESLRPHIYVAEDSASLWEMMARGELLAMVTTASAWQQHPNTDLSVESVNPARNGKSFWARSRSFVVSSKSRLEKEAKDWIQAMTTATAQEEVLHETRMLPALKYMYTPSSLPALHGSMRDRLAQMTDLGLRNSPTIVQEMKQLGHVFGQYIHNLVPLQTLLLQLESLELETTVKSVDPHDEMEKGTSSLDHP